MGELSRDSERRLGVVLSRAAAGLTAPLVRVEAHLGSGLPAFFMVGLPEAAVRESKERVRSALVTAGFEFPSGRITVNLSPADLRKAGGSFDLPIAVGILVAAGHLAPGAVIGREFYGELGLGGELRETARLLPALVEGSRAGRELILPAANLLEASLVAGPKVKLARSLIEVHAALTGKAELKVVLERGSFQHDAHPDLAEVHGQHNAKRALEIAAAGGHGLLFVGPPGSGKTLLAQRLPGLLPPLGWEEALEVASLQSVAGGRPRLCGHRPFRSPQHTASMAALIGNAALKPGELSLAHRGVLFLDELPEFARNALEALREPLESGVVVVSRARRSYELPAKFQLVAAMNPCPCGYAGDSRGRCRCTAGQVAHYRNRLSGPLIDRIDIHVELHPLPPRDLLSPPALPAESSAVVAARVAAAGQLQFARQRKPNSRLTGTEVDVLCPLDRESRALLTRAIEHLGLSARAFHGVLKLARTCADLAGEAHIRPDHVSEAVNLRALDRRATC